MAKPYKKNIKIQRYRYSDYNEPDFDSPKYKKEMRRLKKAVAGKSASEVDPETQEKLNEYYTKKARIKAERTLGPPKYFEERKKETGKAEEFVEDVRAGKIRTSRIGKLPLIRTINKEPKTLGGYASKGFEDVFANEKYQQEIKRINADRKKRGEGKIGFASRLAVYKDIQAERATKFAQSKGISATQLEAKRQKTIKTAKYTAGLVKEKQYGALAKGGAKLGAASTIYGAKKSAKLVKFGVTKSAGLSLAASRTTAKYAGKAMSNLSSAAQRIVESNKLLAILKPMFWYIKIMQIGLSKPMPFIYAGLACGMGLMIWLFGLVSGYYALYFLKCIPAVVLNVPLTIFNAIWYGLFAIFNMVQAGLVTIINQVFYFFVGGLLDSLHNGITIDLGWLGKHNILGIGEGFRGIQFSAASQPDYAFSYLVPQPIDCSHGSVAAFLSLGAYSWIQPGANPYLYDYEIDAPLFKVQIMQNGAELKFPEFNYFMEASPIWTKLKEPPPQIDYSWANKYSGMYWDRDDCKWHKYPQTDISISIIGGATGALNSDPVFIQSGFLMATGYYSATKSSEQRTRADTIFNEAVKEYFIAKGYDSATVNKYANEWASIEPGWNVGKAIWANWPAGMDSSIIGVDYFPYLDAYMDAALVVTQELTWQGYTAATLSDNTPWSVIYGEYYKYIQINIEPWWTNGWKLNDTCHFKILQLSGPKALHMKV
jgi:hypothetical protein